jgi:hypothetical protein
MPASFSSSKLTKGSLSRAIPPASRSRRIWCRNAVFPDRRMPTTAVALPGKATGPRTRRGVLSGIAPESESASFSASRER